MKLTYLGVPLPAPDAGAATEAQDAEPQASAALMAHDGDAAAISGYVGKTDVFDQALGEFALAYADQTAKDHAALVGAVATGRLKAVIEK